VLSWIHNKAIITRTESIPVNPNSGKAWQILLEIGNLPELLSPFWASLKSFK
jgi:hypothetical protein